MSSLYTGVPGNIVALTPVTTTIPADGDPRNVASTNAAFQKLTDYIAYLETICGAVLVWSSSGNPANTTANMLWPGGGATPYTGGASATFGLMMPATGKLSLLRVLHNNGSVTAGTVYTVLKAGSATAITCTVAAGNGAGASDLTHSVAVNAGDVITVQSQGQASITVGAAQVHVSLLYTPN
jgi:hypothetical protein